MGLGVPEELSVTGFDDLEIAAQFSPALTTMHVPAGEMGTRAAAFLLAALDGRPQPTHVELACNLILRETLALPPGRVAQGEV